MGVFMGALFTAKEADGGVMVIELKAPTDHIFGELLSSTLTLLSLLCVSLCSLIFSKKRRSQIYKKVVLQSLRTNSSSVMKTCNRCSDDFYGCD